MVEYSEVLDGPSCMTVSNHPRYIAICAAANRQPWGVLKDGSAEDLPATPEQSSTIVDFWEALYG